MGASTSRTWPWRSVRARQWVVDRALDCRTLAQFASIPVRRSTHQQYLDRFYAPQAGHYDAFRSRLLHGREALFSALPVPQGGVWVDMGAGTCSSLLLLGDRLPLLDRFVAVDLADSLLTVGRNRCHARGWRNVEFVLADAASATLPDGLAADVVTFSYSLTMMPDWRSAITRAHTLLKPGGHIGVVDFYVARQHPLSGWAHHPWLTRHGWPRWFAWNRVRLHAEHLPTLAGLFDPVVRIETRAPVPYLPGLRVPCYRFIGRKSSRGAPALVEPFTAVPGLTSPEPAPLFAGPATRGA
jgi:S-adenosylmethionine-diacylgycerolhomoserine-N-methlytransferase